MPGSARALADSSDFGLLGEQSSQKCDIPCPGRRWTAVQNFTPIALSLSEKSVTVENYKHKYSIALWRRLCLVTLSAASPFWSRCQNRPSGLTRGCGRGQTLAPRLSQGQNFGLKAKINITRLCLMFHVAAKFSISPSKSISGMTIQIKAYKIKSNRTYIQRPLKLNSQRRFLYAWTMYDQRAKC